tara:strand:+ start:11216 stop:11362 length:147 start_codon:yes stop_codon:yes gene_type:complete
MKGLIALVVGKAIKNRKPLLVVKRFLKMKYNIEISVEALKKRFYHGQN